MGVIDDALMKLLAGAGTAGLIAVLWYWQGQVNSKREDKEREANTADRRLFADTIKEVTADTKTALQDIRKAMDANTATMTSTMTEIDRGHTTQTRELFMQVFNVVKEQKDATSQTGQEVRTLDGRVGRIEVEVRETREILDNHGNKLDALVRGIPGPKVVGQIEGKP